MPSENEPATPMSPALAPDVDSAPNVCVVSPPTSVLPASSVAPTDVIVEAPAIARFSTSAYVIATPTPIAVPVALSAVPSAELAASEFADVRSTKAPPAETVSPLGSTAVEELSAIVTAIAAATETPEPELSSALGVAVEPLPAPGATESAWSRSAWTWPLTPPAGAPASPSPGAPAAEAVAFEVALEEPSAWKLTSPPAVTFRSVVEVTEWSAKVSAIAAPTAASAASAPPTASVSADAVSSAFASTLPVVVSVPPVRTPIVAALETLEIAIATAGATATCGLAAPVFAVVVIAWTASARSIRSEAPVRMDSASRAASAASSTRLRATEAPIPREAPRAAASFGRAVAVDEEVDVADSETAEPFAFRDGGPRLDSCRRSAVVFTSTLFSANEPATPMSPPPAPEVALAENVFVLSAAEPDGPAVEAVSEAPSAETIASTPMLASTIAFARLIATPAPTFADPPLAVAAPSALAEASVSPAAVSTSGPPAVTDSASGIVAVALDVARLIAIAAATLIPPSEVSADGFAGVVAPEAPFALARPSAKSRWLCACPSTSCEAVSGAPLALAVAVALDDA